MISSFSKYSVFFFWEIGMLSLKKTYIALSYVKEGVMREREGRKNKLVILYGILLPEAVCILNVKSYVICCIKKEVIKL